MPQEKPKRRLFRLFARDTRSGNGSARSALDESALWSAHQRASLSVRECGQAAQRIASHVAKQRGSVDLLADRGRAISERAGDLLASVARIVDSFARLELVALNAGLEGARMSDAAAHALGLVSDEVRAQTARGTEASRELAAALNEVRSELGVIHANLERTRDGVDEVAQEATHVGTASTEAERALSDIGDRFRKTTGSDPETSRAIEEATEHARALVTTLGTLSGKVPQSLVTGALRPVLEPLSRLLGGEEDEA